MHAYPGLGFPVFADMFCETTSYVKECDSSCELELCAASDNMDIVRAEYGQPGAGGYGGAGFSGGGGCNVFGVGCNDVVCGNGGSNGSDGQPGGVDCNCEGGAGAGVNISTIRLTSFVLSPGEGGIANSGDSIFGGGGGGVLINGKGPPAPNRGWGEGFGGGGSNGYNGLPGAVIFDFMPDE